MAIVHLMRLFIFHLMGWGWFFSTLTKWLRGCSLIASWWKFGCWSNCTVLLIECPRGCRSCSWGLRGRLASCWGSLRVIAFRAISMWVRDHLFFHATMLVSSASYRSDHTSFPPHPSPHFHPPSHQTSPYSRHSPISMTNLKSQYHEELRYNYSRNQ